jgi:TRAP-type C4-dicarboxylate transport system permease small subunit
MAVLKFIWKMEVVFIAVSLAIMATVTFAAVICRYFLHYPLPWSEELVRYLFAWSSMVGSSVAVRTGAHIGINVLTDRLSDRIRKPVEIVAFLFSIGFCVALFFMGFEQMMNQSHQQSPAMLINMALVYACLPVGSILMIISFVAMMLQEVGLFKMPSADVEVKEVI